MEITTHGCGLTVLVRIFRNQGFLKRTFLVPSDFLEGPFTELARECGYGKQYSEKTHAPLRDWIVLPYMKEIGHI
jgi:hypothetical protein